ncbi:hypothetical protein LOTGIDRAFT_232120 [Lottia gigantea]|uniref:Small ribosomal subunit protein mS39 n=1 Tax=Lottia gigantea TaxID=225164 RepID=V4ADP1_LOTGI|nr:hypothetical protein LOTGIDRAFT_232120 [Lottia gigantea]ESO94967.1 hypothetical protein LOTGIDRAFT_232120 [Lottia gigantea]
MAISIQCLHRSSISNLTKIIRFLSSNNQLRVQSRACSQSSIRQNDIKDDDIDISQVVIPKKIHREPTAILRALSATVERDSTGPDYCFIDDPYLTTFEHHNKKKHAEAIGAGRRAARFIIDNYPKGFLKYRNYPERYLPTCEPKQIQYKFKNPCEEALKERIRLRNVSDAIEVFDFLKSTNDEVSLDTKLDLLDLLCVYNCRKPPIDAIKEEKLYSKFYENVHLEPSWRKNNEAEKLFKELPTKPARAYNTLLQGRAEHGDNESAQKLYLEMVSSKIPVDLESYNKLIQSYSKIADSMDPIENLLTEMEANGVKPTVKTFEAVLSVLAWIGTSDKSYAITVFNEMKKLNIEPTLGCFRFLLDIVYSPHSSAYVLKMEGTKRHRDPYLLHQVMDYLEANYVFHEDNMESYFLSSSFCIQVMMIISRNLRDDELCGKLLKFYDKNPNLMSDRGGLLHNWYFQFLIQQGDIHKVMKEFRRLIPYTTAMKKEYVDLFPLIELTEEYHYLLDIWTALSMGEYYRFQNEIQMFFSLVAKQTFKDDLQNQFCNMVDTLVEKRNKTLLLSNEKFRITISADLICKLILVYLNGNQLNKAWQLFIDLATNRKRFPGMANVQALSQLASTCLEEEVVTKAMEVITFMSEEEMPISPKLIASIQEKDKKEASKDL